MVSKEEPIGTKNSFKCFIGCNDNNVIRPLYIKFPQMIGYVRKRDVNTIMSFKISDKQLLKKYNQAWKKAKSLLNTKFDSKPVYGDNDKYIKTKIKIYSGSVNTNLQGKHIPKEEAPRKCLSIIILDSVIKSKKKCYPQHFEKNANMNQKKIKMENLIDDDLKKSFV